MWLSVNKLCVILLMITNQDGHIAKEEHPTAGGQGKDWEGKQRRREDTLWRRGGRLEGEERFAVSVRSAG